MKTLLQELFRTISIRPMKKMGATESYPISAMIGAAGTSGSSAAGLR
jgi:hypothetical protein